MNPQATVVALDGPHFLLNGRRTYPGTPGEGLLLNSRMIQAIVDEENDALRARWAYPDTGQWDAERNTREFCAMLPHYRAQGLLAVTIGLQGGGSNYRAEIMDHSQMSAFTTGGDLKPAYLKRLTQVLAAADTAGIVVIVSLFYWAQIRHLHGPDAIRRAVFNTADWLLRSGHRNIIVEIANEIRPSWPAPLQPGTIHHLLGLVKSISLGGHRLLVGCSAHPHEPIPPESWLATEDITLPHGNDRTPVRLRACLRALRGTTAYQRRPARS